MFLRDCNQIRYIYNILNVFAIYESGENLAGMLVEMKYA